MNIQQIILLVWSTCFVIEAINLYVSYIKFKQYLKKPEHADVAAMIKYFSEVSPHGIKMKKILFNPYSCFIYAIIGFIISPFIIPISIGTLFKKVFKLKTKLDKKIDEQNKVLEASAQQAVIQETVIEEQLKAETIEEPFEGTGIRCELLIVEETVIEEQPEPEAQEDLPVVEENVIEEQPEIFETPKETPPAIQNGHSA